MNRFPAGITALLLTAAVAQSQTPAQTRRGVITGIVKDAIGGSPLPGAQVVVKNTDIRTMTDMSGRFVLTGVWPGATEVQSRRVGYRMFRTLVTVPAGDTVRSDIEMRPVVDCLDCGPDGNGVVIGGVETNAAAYSTRMALFEQRRARGGGAFITRADIEKRRPNKLSEMLRSVAGVSLKTNSSAGQQPVIQIERSSSGIANGTCEVQLYVDGHPYPRGSIDDFPPETVEGIEVYRGGSELPVELRAQNAGCGAIGIWTRDPTLIQRKP
jgi:hypothetical protein